MRHTPYRSCFRHQFVILCVTEWSFIIRMMEYLFSYGTLQKNGVQVELFGRRLTGSRDILVGYRTSAIEIEDEVFLAKGEEKSQLTTFFTGDGNDTIDGMVFEVSTEEMIEADRYEPAGYERVRVTLGSGKEAWMYMAVTA